MSTWMDSPATSGYQVNATTVAMGINTMVNYTGGSGTSSPSEAGAKFNPSMAIIIVVLLGTFFFMAFLSIYVKKCVTTEGDMEHHHIPMSWAVDHSTGMRRWHPHPTALVLHQPQGLDKASIQALPLVCFTKSKDCVVCLSEFQQNDCLRLLPRCGHTFHVECIDMWLVSHTTCPICRFNLVLPPPEPAAAAPPAAAAGSNVHHLSNSSQNIQQQHQQSEPVPPQSAAPAPPATGESNRSDRSAAIVPGGPVHQNSSPAAELEATPNLQQHVSQGEVLISIAELEGVSHEQECVEEQQGGGRNQNQSVHVPGVLLKVWKVFKSWKVTGFGTRIFS